MTDGAAGSGGTAMSAASASFDASSPIRAWLSMSLGPCFYMPRGGVRPYRAMMSGSHAGWANGNW